MVSHTSEVCSYSPACSVCTPHTIPIAMMALCCRPGRTESQWQQLQLDARELLHSPPAQAEQGLFSARLLELLRQERVSGSEDARLGPTYPRGWLLVCHGLRVTPALLVPSQMEEMGSASPRALQCPCYHLQHRCHWSPGPAATATGH